ncbi:hypothetical protein V8F63_10650 [Brevundimonas sp. LF-1]|uniref:hypothetical protein n=1 Tax=Brevundimonas sp. LF-1 TaxID=3126100 RepID=UPI0030DE3B7E
MLHEHVGLFEGAFVQQDADAFAGGQLALGVLAGDALLAPAQLGGGATALEAPRGWPGSWLGDSLTSFRVQQAAWLQKGNRNFAKGFQVRKPAKADRRFCKVAMPNNHG